MQPIEHIRIKVLHLNQAEFADVAGVSQASVSRWEAGKLEPGREELGRIRDYAREKGIDWDDRWFFEAPPKAEEQSQEHVA